MPNSSLKRVHSSSPVLVQSFKGCALTDPYTCEERICHQLAEDMINGLSWGAICQGMPPEGVCFAEWRIKRSRTNLDPPRGRISKLPRAFGRKVHFEGYVIGDDADITLAMHHLADAMGRVVKRGRLCRDGKAWAQWRLSIERTINPKSR